MFSGGPLSYQLKSVSICRELKFIAVGQLASLEHQPTQFWPQLIEMPFALFGIEGQTVTGKRRFVRGRYSQKRKYHNQQKYSHESTLRLKPEFKSSADFIARFLQRRRCRQGLHETEFRPPDPSFRG